MNPHGASLPLFNTIQGLSGKSVIESIDAVSSVLTALALADDIEQVVVFNGLLTVINLEPTTPAGKAVLTEMEQRAEASFLPCPDGSCEYDSSDVCRWCGNPK